MSEHNGDNVDLPVITAWEKPSEGWLKVTVREPLLGMTESYYWTEYDDRLTWHTWSMAGKPSVRVRNEKHVALLSNLVLGHDLLRHVGADLGIEWLPASGRST